MGDAEDGTPLVWTQYPGSSGDYDASSGDYVFSPTPESGRFMARNALALNFDDISIRVQGRISAESGSFEFSVRNQAGNDAKSYVAGVTYSTSLGGSVAFVGRVDGRNRIRRR